VGQLRRRARAPRRTAGRDGRRAQRRIDLPGVHAWSPRRGAARSAVARSLPRSPPVDPSRRGRCSHVGGDRFAANVVVAPYGLYYGHVPPAEVLGLVRRTSRGSSHQRSCGGGRRSAHRSRRRCTMRARHWVSSRINGIDLVAEAPANAGDASPPGLVARAPGHDSGVLDVVVRASDKAVDGPAHLRRGRQGHIRSFDLVSLDLPPPEPRTGVVRTDHGRHDHPSGATARELPRRFSLYMDDLRTTAPRTTTPRTAPRRSCTCSRTTYRSRSCRPRRSDRAHVRRDPRRRGRPGDAWWTR
jgi:hypothetical protein